MMSENLHKEWIIVNSKMDEQRSSKGQGGYLTGEEPEVNSSVETYISRRLKTKQTDWLLCKGISLRT